MKKAFIIGCVSSHTKADSKDQAGIPNTKDCLACHRRFQTASATLQTLLAYEKAEKEIAWARIYKLPGFVFFSHQAHLKAKANCATCHGDVQARAALWQEKEISMAACVNCHKERQASTDCNLCHAETINPVCSSFQIHATRFAIDMKKKNGTNGKDGKDGTNGAIQSQAPFVPLFPFVPFFFFISIANLVAWI